MVVARGEHDCTENSTAKQNYSLQSHQLLTQLLDVMFKLLQIDGNRWLKPIEVVADI